MQRLNSLEKGLLLGKMEGRRGHLTARCPPLWWRCPNSKVSSTHHQGFSANECTVGKPEGSSYGQITTEKKSTMWLLGNKKILIAYNKSKEILADIFVNHLPFP